MIPYYPAVFIGPNGEQFPMGYHPPPPSMAVPYDHHPSTPHHPHHPLPHQHHPLRHPQQQQQQQHQHHSLLQQHHHHHQQQQQQVRGPFPIHGPTSTPLPFVRTTIKLSGDDEASTLDSISTPDMDRLGSSYTLKGDGTVSNPVVVKSDADGIEAHTRQEDGDRDCSNNYSEDHTAGTTTSTTTGYSTSSSTTVSAPSAKAPLNSSISTSSNAKKPTSHIDANCNNNPHTTTPLHHSHTSHSRHSLTSSVSSSSSSSAAASTPSSLSPVPLASAAVDNSNLQPTTTTKAITTITNETGLGMGMGVGTVAGTKETTGAPTHPVPTPSTAITVNAVDTGTITTTTTTTTTAAAAASSPSSSSAPQTLSTGVGANQATTTSSSSVPSQAMMDARHENDTNGPECGTVDVARDVAKDTQHDREHPRTLQDELSSASPSPYSSSTSTSSPPPPQPLNQQQQQQNRHQKSLSSSSQHSQNHNHQHPTVNTAPRQASPSSGNRLSLQSHHQPSHRSTPTTPYYHTRPNHGPSKPYPGQQGLGPTLPGTHAFPPGPGPAGPGPGPLPGGMQGYGAPPPPFFGNNAPPVPPPPPGPRRPVVYPGQPPIHSGSHPIPLTNARPGQPYHNPAGYKQPYINQGYPPDYQQVGYYPGSEGWRPTPTPALQKKPKELDKAMWVGNVLNDTTLTELQAIFETEPTEAEGDVQHDIPESIFILSKSNCAFVNYSSHEAVDRAVRRFHDREFKNTRLVCRPRKDPASDPYSNKIAGSNRFPHSQHHYPFMPDSMGYYSSDHPSFVHQHQQQQQQQQQPIGAQHDLSDAQSRMERMRLEASPIHDSSSSTGDGPSSLLDPGKHKDKGSSKKSRSSSSLGYAESRYFILKGLTEEDLKVSVQYGIWATQEHLVPTLNDAFVNSKNVYLVFSANKSGEFFGYARMMDLISAEKEVALMTGKDGEIWRPAFEEPLSPEMKAAMLEEIEQTTKEGRQITWEEASAIARASTTTKSWGTRFPIQWIHIFKVPFSKTSHLLNPLYENREIKVSKDGTEVDPVVGEQLLELFKKSDRNRRGRTSASGNGTRSNSEVSESRRSSVTGEATNQPHQPNQRSASSRRSSVLSMRSTGSGGGGDRRSSIDPSRTPGSHKQTHSPQHAMSPRGQFGGGDGNQIHPNIGNYRSSSRHNYYGGHGGYIAGSPQGAYLDHQAPFQEQHRANWNYKSNYRGGAGGYGSMPSGGPPMQGNYYQHDGHGTHRKGSGGGLGGGGGGGKYGVGYHPSHQNNNIGGGYDSYPFPSPNVPRRHPGPQQQQQYPPGYRSNGSPPGADSSLSGPPTFKHATSGNTSNISGPQGTNDQNYGGGRGGPASGRHAPSNQPVPPHSNTYPGQMPPGGYHAPYPLPGYAVMPPYMGYPYVPGPTPFVHGTMAWHPAQGLPLPTGMIPGAGMVPSHGSSVPMMPGATPEGPGMEGLVPLIGYDGVTYAYIPAEEAYHQAMYGYGYMPHDQHVAEQAEMDVANHASDDGQVEAGAEDQLGHGTEQGSDGNKASPQSLTGVEQGADQKHNESLSTHSATSAQSTSLSHDHSAPAKMESDKEDANTSVII